jgi:Cytochrome P460
MSRLLLVLTKFLLIGWFCLCFTISFSAWAETDTQPNADDKSANLPLPSARPLQDYERVLFRFLMERKYARLGWADDKEVRDTGPYIQNQYYGTHPAVKIYYSPSVLTWLQNGRKGELPDGAMIIKEMYSPPAVLYQELKGDPNYADPKAYEQVMGRLLTAWTVMVRDRKASKDGWFWAGPGAPGKGQSIEKAIESQLDNLKSAPNAMFGAPCLRCHSSAENQLTFSSLRNVTGFLPEQEPLRFLVDNSWRSKAHFSNYPLSILVDDPYVQAHFMVTDLLRPYSPTNAIGKEKDGDFHLGLNRTLGAERLTNNEALKTPNPEFLKVYDMMKPEPADQVQVFPSQWQDQVLPAADKPQAFMTSDNCLGCHGGLGGNPYGVTMFVSTGPKYGDGFNLSEYGEWRWSPMGLAGRDSIFFAQMESEQAYLRQDAERKPSPLVGSLEANQHAVTNTCLSCHGAMGQRTLEREAKTNPHLDPNFKVDYMFLQERLTKKAPNPPEQQYLKFGQLGREGISCTICHHIDAPSVQAIKGWQPPAGYLSASTNKELAYYLYHNNTGRFVEGPNDAFFGPFKDVKTLPMEHSLGVKPIQNEFIQNSQMCGACHSINLPNIGATQAKFPVLDNAEQNPAFKPYQHSIEQATFIEWQNSAFARKPDFASCQDCHMPRDFATPDGKVKVDKLATQIAAIQNANFPEADNRLPVAKIDVPVRDNYRRHEHAGLNVFLLEMFDQFPDILGVDKVDYMTSAANGVDTAIGNMILQAQQKTADIDVKIDSVKEKALEATVTVRNKTGHRFPSGVAFRRAFIELLVLDGNKVVWGSGRTNAVGVIVDANGKPLETEFLPSSDAYQPHHQTITREDQVQIYEELNQDAQHEFTTSFIHRVYDVKDNRLLPKGWRSSEHFKNDGEVIRQFFEATDPKAIGNDPDYADQGDAFPGQDSIQYQITLPETVDPAKLTVSATLYDQSIPPYWLHQRFTAAPDGPATKRLYYMASHLDLAGTPMADWKLRLVSKQVHP